MSITAEPPPRTKRRTDTKTRTKQQPPYAVVIINDDVHTFEYVIICISKVFKYDLDKCKRLTMDVHTKGRAIVWVGSLELAELKKEQIEGMGPDPFANKVCDFPLKVELEPQ